LAERIFGCDQCGLVMDRDRNAAANLAAWAEQHHARVPDRQAGGRVSNALEGTALAIAVRMVQPALMKGEPGSGHLSQGHPRRVLLGHLTEAAGRL
jgi:putative transposase